MITSDRRIYGGRLSRIPRRKCSRPSASPFNAAAAARLAPDCLQDAPITRSILPEEPISMLRYDFSP